ncbi:hypothetical protein M569_08493, partial [Genlisea aurea]
LAKDVVKAVKKRLQHKNPTVQLLSLTLLEMMVKNCGDHVHFQIAERDILPEMIKIVRKKTDMQVRDKILTLIGAWNEAFGGVPGGRYPQYHMAYEELRRSGVKFPRHSPDAALIFTPPAVHPTSRYSQPGGYGIPSSSSTRLDEAMAADNSISLSNLHSMREVLDLLADMLRAVNPADRSAVKDEVIVDLVEQCRVNQRKLMQFLETTGDEELLRQGLELNDNLQTTLAKRDAIASGSPLLPPESSTNSSPPKASRKDESSPEPNEAAGDDDTNPSPLVLVKTSLIDDDEDEEEDDFAKLARRHSVGVSQEKSSTDGFHSPDFSTALVPVYSTEAIRSKDQDIIDLLSLTLTTTTTTTTLPNEPTSEFPPRRTDGAGNGRFSSEEAYPGHPGVAFNNTYVAPWAQPQQQINEHATNDAAPSPYYYGVYPPPPWASSPSYNGNPNSGQPPTTTTAGRPAMMVPSNFEDRSFFSPRSTTTAAATGTAQRPFVPSYKLFDDLDVFGGATGGRFKATTNSILGANSNNMVGGRK